MFPRPPGPRKDRPGKSDSATGREITVLSVWMSAQAEDAEDTDVAGNKWYYWGKKAFLNLVCSVPINEPLRSDMPSPFQALR